MTNTILVLATIIDVGSGGPVPFYNRVYNEFDANTLDGLADVSEATWLQIITRVTDGVVLGIEARRVREDYKPVEHPAWHTLNEWSGGNPLVDDRIVIGEKLKPIFETA